MAGQTLLDHLARCQTAELIRKVRAEPELEFWFKHALVQEAAYESLLKSARAELHGLVAEVIEGSTGSHREADAAVLALHYERADMDAKAFPYAIIAADRARQTYAHREALAFYDRALAMAERIGSRDPSLVTRVRNIYDSRGRVLEVAGDHPAAETNYRQMLAVAERAGDEAMQADALIHLATVQILRGGQAPDLASNLDEALRLAARCDEPILTGKALWNMGLRERFGDPLASIGYFERALALTQAEPADLPLRELAGTIWNDLTISYVVSGQFHRALATKTQAIAAFRELDNRPMLADALGGAARVFYYMGDVAQALTFAGEGAAISKAIENPWGVVYNGWSLQEIEIDTGQFEITLANADQRIAAARRIAFPVFTGLLLSQVARAYFELGQADRMEPLAEEAVSLFVARGMPSWAILGRGVAGSAALARGDLTAAQALLEPLWHPGDDPVHAFQGFLVAGPAFAEWSLAAGRLDLGLEFCDWMLARLTNEEVWRSAGEMYYARGRIYLARGDWARAETDLLESRVRLADAQVAILTWKADAALATLYAARGDAARAVAAREQARQGISRLANGIHDRELRRSFLNRADVREVLQA
jgi:tetratricopeptide (TPR) repeat protein